MMITRAELVSKLVFDSESEFYWRNARMGRPTARSENRAAAGYMAPDGRVMIRIDGTPYQATHLAALWYYGKLPVRVDLIDKNPRNLRKENLRIKWPMTREEWQQWRSKRAMARAVAHQQECAA